MEQLEAKKIVKEINQIVCSRLWMDFEVNQYNGYDLIILGSIDLSYKDYFICITFSNIYFFCLNTSWKSDTKNDVLVFIEEPERKEIGQKYLFDKEYHVFRFIAEDSLNLIIAAEEVSYENGASGV